MKSHWNSILGRAQLGLGTLLVSVAVAALPIAAVMRLAQGVSSPGGYVFAGLFCLAGIVEAEFVFWQLVMPVFNRRREAALPGSDDYIRAEPIRRDKLALFD